jgi:5-methylcytosine-specific restriction endonuclease McrA
MFCLTHDCKSSNWQIRRRWTHNRTAVQYVRQCLNCGSNVGGCVAKAVATVNGECPEWDEELSKHWHAETVSMRDLEKQEWRGQYQAYLRSPEWAQKRKLVLQRDGGICRGCLVKPATQVHHLSYRRVFNEPAWDLVSICDACHDACHSEQDDEPQA